MYFLSIKSMEFVTVENVDFIFGGHHLTREFTPADARRVKFEFNVSRLVEDGTTIRLPYVVTICDQEVDLSWGNAVALWVSIGKDRQAFINLTD